MDIHTRNKRLPPVLNLGRYEARKGCADCDNSVWYEVDGEGQRWHKGWRWCGGNDRMKVWVIMAGESMYPIGSGGKTACYLHKCRAEAMMETVKKWDAEYFTARGEPSLKSVEADEDMLNLLDLDIIKRRAGDDG